MASSRVREDLADIVNMAIEAVMEVAEPMTGPKTIFLETA
jgi:hypothetical protein